jgi:DNA-binding NtrC family response regulator
VVVENSAAAELLANQVLAIKRSVALAVLEHPHEKAVSAISNGDLECSLITLQYFIRTSYFMISRDSTLRVVAIDDDEQQLKLIATVLSQESVDVSTAGNPKDGLELVRREHPHLVLVDLLMPCMSGMEVLERIVDFDPSIDVVLLTGQYSTESAVEAIQKGAADYLTKPVDVDKLQQRVESLLSELHKGQRCLQLEHELLDNSQFAAMVGHSAVMLELFRRIRRVAPHFRTVLLTGETGVGKELAAHALHNLSPVSSGPFVACNCSAVVETLAESELFGHVKGAFTGAVQDRVGVFEAASKGTVLLDEVGELSLSLQAKLLRVLQNQEIQRVGSPVARRVDVRVIAATHRDLQSMVKEQRFREDLFYRLSMVQIKVPTLAQRKEDLPLLERYFLKRFAEQFSRPVRGITRRAQAVLARHSWPGNVRELENVLGNACMMMEGETIDLRDLPEYLRDTPASAAQSQTSPTTLDEVERNHALHILESVGGNKVRAAELLGISRTKLYRILGDVDSLEADVTAPANLPEETS